MKRVASIGTRLSRGRKLELFSNEGTKRIQICQEGVPICKHTHDYKEITGWLMDHAEHDSLCPSCYKTNASNAIRYSGRNDGGMEDWDSDFDDMSVTSESQEECVLPDWFMREITPVAKNIIAQHYQTGLIYDDLFTGVIPDNPSLEVLYSTAKNFNKQITLNLGKGVFATKRIPMDSEMGEYRGNIIFDYKIIERSKSTKLLGMEIMGIDFAVDAQNHWSGLMNHKWNWPYRDQSIPEAYERYFSNTEVSDTGRITAMRDINAGEELSFDYGIPYWNKGILPYWILSYGRTAGSYREDLEHGSFEDFVLQDKECFILLLTSTPINYSPEFPDKLKRAAKKHGLSKELLNGAMWKSLERF